MKRLGIYCLALMVMLFSSCTKDDWLGFFVGGQPDFYEEDLYDKQLNVFVILRGDSIGGLSESVFEISRTRMAVGDTMSDYELLTGAQIAIYKEKAQPAFSPSDASAWSHSKSAMHDNPRASVDSVKLTWWKRDSVVMDYPQSRAVDFLTPGKEYAIEVRAAGFPVLTSSSRIPAVPELEGGVEVSGNNYSFRLLHDSTIYLYEVFLIYGTAPGPATRVEKIPGQDYTDVTVENAIPRYTPTGIMIYGYDEKLTTYYSYSNVFIKPNTYRPPFTTVEGGYGCFGSLSELEVAVPVAAVTK